MQRGGSTPPDAAVVATADAAVLEPDPVEITPDTAAVRPDAIEDAAVKVEDAAVVVVDADLRDPVVVAFDDKRYVDVVAECTRVFTVEHASVCTLAACRTHQDVRAQKWHGKIANAAAKRTTAATCREVGVDVIPKIMRPPTKPDAGVDPCAVNPMACQR